MGTKITSPILRCEGHEGLPKYVFVLSLENRSFDHLFGRSGISGKDAAGKSSKRSVDGVLDARGNIDPKYTNSYGGKTYGIPNTDAPFIMPSDPKHEFEHILCQVCGPEATAAMMKAFRAAPDKMTFAENPSSDKKVRDTQVYADVIPVPPQSSPAKGVQAAFNRPPPNNSGFVHSYVRSFTTNTSETGGDVPNAAATCPDPQLVMTCFDTKQQLPILHQLASNYLICDNFFSSLPGPTGPNRFFMMAGSSAGYDGGPTSTDMLSWQSKSHLPANKGNIFSKLEALNVPFRIYGDDNIPMSGVMEGVHSTNTFDVHDGTTHITPLQKMLKEASFDKPFPYNFVWIEPDYDVASSLGRHPMYRTGNSMHPCSDVRKAEELIADIYNWISGNKSVWENCVLFITWDEHGGFYDHVPSPSAPAPGDSPALGRTWGFDFKTLGTRVPCIVVSPFIESNLVDNRPYDHCSILMTVVDLYNKGAFTNGKAPATKLEPWTERIRWARSMLSLFTADSTKATIIALGTPLEPAPTPPDTGVTTAALEPPSGNTPIFLAAARGLQESADPSFDPGAALASVTTNEGAADYFDKAARAVDVAQQRQAATGTALA